MAIIAPRTDSRPRPASLSIELRLDVLGQLTEHPADQLLAALELGHQALGLEWTAPAAHHTDDVLARIDQALAEATR